MKLNFWQWLGVILLILGCIGWWYARHASRTAPPAASTSQSVER